MLEGEPDLEIVGEAQDGQEALELCRRLCPELVLMDVRMPRMDGLDATQKIKEECPKTSVLIMTSHENPEYLLEAIRAGAAGYILKEATQQQVIEAIRELLSGEFPLNRGLAVRLIRRLADEETHKKKKDEEPTTFEERAEPLLPTSLSPREVEVLKLLVRGQTNEEIAKNLLVSVSTVKKHMHQLIAKLGVSDRTQAAVRAVELGLLDEQ